MWREAPGDTEVGRRVLGQLIDTKVLAVAMTMSKDKDMFVSVSMTIHGCERLPRGCEAG